MKRNVSFQVAAHLLAQLLEFRLLLLLPHLLLFLLQRAVMNTNDADMQEQYPAVPPPPPVSYPHLRAHHTLLGLVCRRLH